MENLSRVFQKQNRKKKTLEETEFHNSIQEDYLPLVEKCLEKCLLVSYLMLWERINGKPVIFLYCLAGQHQYPQTITF